MTNSTTSAVLQHLLAASGLDGAGATDGDLLTCFVSGGDAVALAALVRRHAPMVWGVCCRLLHHHDAEDAFQATFLVFVRKARGVPNEAVGNWLYGVARQTAVRMRATAARRGAREAQVVDMPEPAAAERPLWDDLRPLLDQELSRLPRNCRAVIVLCDLEGRTRKEAARQLGLPEGTVASRLARARVMLAKRLTRRGVALSGGVLATLVSENVTSAGAPPTLVSFTINAASLFASGRALAGRAVSAEVAVLTEGVVKAMTFHTFKIVAAVLLAVALAGVGCGGAMALRAEDKGGRVGYQPPGVTPVVVAGGIAVQQVEVALDANGGRNNPYFYSPPDAANVNHLWHLRKTGDSYMILPKVGEGKLALDANGGRNNPYFSKPDPTNINHLWTLTKVDACYVIAPKVGGGKQALDANGGQNNPYFRKLDATNVNCLWELRVVGDDFMLIPLVRRGVAAPIWTPGTGGPTPFTPSKRQPQTDPAPKGGPDKGPAKGTAGDDARREIEKIIKRAEEAGGDRRTALEEIEKVVKELKENAKK